MREPAQVRQLSRSDRGEGDARRSASVMTRPVAAVFAVAALAIMPPASAAESVSDVFDRVTGSVVVVRTVEHKLRADRQMVSTPAVGSGVLISADGKILTAAHVVDLADEVQIELASGQQLVARVVASEPDADVALLQVSSVQLPPGTVSARLADSDHARIGEPVFVVGAPYGISHTLTVGHLSGRHRPGHGWQRFALAEFLQTDAAINPGNSGGPLFNLAGEVLGIASHIVSKSGGFEGLGFAVSANSARRLLLDRPEPWWGFGGVMITNELLHVFNLAQPVLLVERVVKNSPAERLEACGAGS